MGVDNQTLDVLLEAKRMGVSFASTIMVGRQNFYKVSPSALAQALQVSTHEAETLLSHHFIEPLLASFGASRIESLDYSAYENATTIHDLNTPIPSHLKNSFSCVFDGGTIEHVFNFPQAIKNCMEMVALGGHFLSCAVANNCMGHGLYQFSPELYFRVFSPENGFQIEDIFVWEADRNSPWYRVTDPAILGQRVELLNTRPTALSVIARRISIQEIFKNTPQQSDYKAVWSNQNQSQTQETPTMSLRRMISRSIPEPVKEFLRRTIFDLRRKGFSSRGYSHRPKNRMPAKCAPEGE